MKLPIVVISSGIKSESSIIENAIQELIKEIRKNGDEVKSISGLEDGLMFVQANANLGCILLELTEAQQKKLQVKPKETLIYDIIRTIRSKNKNIPIFLLAKTSINNFPLEIRRETQEFICLISDTPVFITGRINFAIKKYYKSLLPPFFGTLKNFAEDTPYYWDCPGHMGGEAYLKHPIGTQFHEFLGEPVMRADVGVMAPSLGDSLTHKGVPGESEKNAARIFGADHTFYVLGGSSASNKIVAGGSIRNSDLVYVDRNCHKSLNHALTITGAKPKYLVPARNGYGLLGLIPAGDFKNLDPEAVSVIITNCTYDGLCYRMDKIAPQIQQAQIPQIHFDEAWYAHARFHPLYKGYYAMDIDNDTANMPLIYSVQSTHKMLPALSMASMIHIKGAEKKRFEFDRFNQAFMMHGTTSPFYPIIASIDIATSMMDEPAGPTLMGETLINAIEFRQVIVQTAKEYQLSDPDDWFFNVYQPEKIDDRYFHEIPPEELLDNPSCWVLKPGDNRWHGFNDEDVKDEYYLLDPVKVTILTPGITAGGSMEDFGIPAVIISKFLDSKRIHVAKNGDYTILVLFTVGNTKGKWGTLLSELIGFKNAFDNNTDISEAIPDVVQAHPGYYGVAKSVLPTGEEINSLKDMVDNKCKLNITSQWSFKTLKDLSKTMHDVMKALNLPGLLDKSCAYNYETPPYTPAAAFQKLIGETDTVKINIWDINDEEHIAAVMVVPYPPGIPIIMPGEKILTSHITFLKAIDIFNRLFPGFGSIPHGLEDAEEGFVLRVICPSKS